MFATVVIGFVIIFLFVCWLHKWQRFVKCINKMPGPKSHPIFGEVYYFKTNIADYFKQLRGFANRFPYGYKIRSGFLGCANILDPEDIEIVLSSSRHIEKSLFYGMMQPWLGTGLLTSTSAKWQHRRKILTPAFHFNILRKFIDIFVEHSQQLVEELKNECEKPKTNLLPVISKSTLDIICETAMGTKLDSYNKTQMEYRQAIHDLAPLIVERTVKPWYYSNFTHWFSTNGRKQRKLLKKLHAFTKSVIEEREKNFDEKTMESFDLENDKDVVYSSKKRLAMLDLLIHAKKCGEIDSKGIQEEVDTFMFEGHDTTSIGICCILLMLSIEKEHQEKVYEELYDIFGDSDQAPTYEDLQNMKYLELFIKESLRLYPSVPFISRVLNEDVQLKNYFLPEGTVVNIHIFDIHRNEKWFPNPEKFDPNRFLLENSAGRHPFVYIPFSAGPRNCIGQKFAMLELKCIISSIIRNYILEPISRPEDINMMVDFVLRTEDPIDIKFRPRVR